MFTAFIIFTPYYNWQYAKNNGFASWLFFGEIVATAKAFAWPYFLFFKRYSLSNQNNRKVETIPDTIKKSPTAKPPDFNASELDRYSKVLNKAMSYELNKQDLKILRSVISDYTSRTGRMLTKDEYELFMGVIELTSNYQYELGQSMLFSWDSKKYFTTNKLDDFYKIMKTMRLRKPELLKNDIENIKAASQNQYFIKDKFGNKYEFSREIILKGIDENNLVRNNYEKISLVMKDFVQ